MNKLTLHQIRQTEINPDIVEQCEVHPLPVLME